MKPPTLEDVRIFPSAVDFHTWLEAHHDTATELWVVEAWTGAGTHVDVELPFRDYRGAASP